MMHWETTTEATLNMNGDVSNSNGNDDGGVGSNGFSFSGSAWEEFSAWKSPSATMTTTTASMRQLQQQREPTHEEQHQQQRQDVEGFEKMNSEPTRRSRRQQRQREIAEQLKNAISSDDVLLESSGKPMYVVKCFKHGLLRYLRTVKKQRSSLSSSSTSMHDFSGQENVSLDFEGLDGGFGNSAVVRSIVETVWEKGGRFLVFDETTKTLIMPPNQDVFLKVHNDLHRLDSPIPSLIEKLTSTKTAATSKKSSSSAAAKKKTATAKKNNSSSTVKKIKKKKLAGGSAARKSALAGKKSSKTTTATSNNKNTNTKKQRASKNIKEQKKSSPNIVNSKKIKGNKNSKKASGAME